MGVIDINTTALLIIEGIGFILAIGTAYVYIRVQIGNLSTRVAALEEHAQKGDAEHAEIKKKISDDIGRLWAHLDKKFDAVQKGQAELGQRIAKIEGATEAKRE